MTPAGEPPLGSLAVADDRPAVIEPGRGLVSYAELDRLADRVATRLRGLGLEPGARLGLCLRRSCDAVAAMLGALRAGCVYVPVDPAAPAERNAEIHADCAVRMTLIEEDLAAAYRDASAGLGAAPDIQGVAAVGLGRAIDAWAGTDGSSTVPVRPLPVPPPAAGGGRSGEHRGVHGHSDLACILYTSGSTGRHKGWMMSRTAIAALANWSHAPPLEIGAAEVFANHAPFNFAMSLFDIYSSLGCGATLMLMPDEIRAFAGRVVDLLERERATVLFATPAILSRICAVDDLEARDLSALRLIVFGGEVFPAPPLAALRRRLRTPRYFNCWGSTETNIGTWFELPPDLELDGPPPIGQPLAHYEARIVGVDGEIVRPGEVGELQLRGAGLTTGYVGQPALNAERLIPTPDGGPWYRTADLVVETPSDGLRYAGRIGRMVKVRGHRVEPGEIEARLYQHPAICEASVVAIDGPHGPQLVAHLSGQRLSIVELKQFCAVKLPTYMIPERFVFHEALPRNPRGKVDLQQLREHGEH